MALADDGTVYVGGVTMSTDFPGARAAQVGPGGSPDGFIARFRPGDSKSLQTVLLGGAGREQITALALDARGNLFVTGYTTSADFPTANAVQPRFGGGADAFLVKVRTSDWKLLFSTYLGGTKMDGAYGLSIDADGNPIVSGVTESSDFPSTPSAFQPRLRGTVDAFVTKLSADGARILWSTYYGGSKANSDQFLGGSQAIDEAGRVWFTGMTNSTDLPTKSAAQPNNGGGDFDGFLAALSPDGSKLCYATYVGGNGHDILEGLAIHKGQIYAAGLTASQNFSKSGKYGGGPYDAMVVGLDHPGCR